MRVIWAGAGQGVCEGRVGWLEGQVRLLGQDGSGDQVNAGLGRSEGVGDGTGVCRGPGLQVASVDRRAGGSVYDAERAFGVGPGPGRRAAPVEWLGRGPGRLVGWSVAAACRARDVVVDGSELVRCGAGAATLTWASC